MSPRPVAVLVAAEPNEHILLERLLRRHFPCVELQAFSNPTEAFSRLRSPEVKLLFTRGRVGTDDSLSFLTQVRSERPDLAILFTTLRRDLAERVRHAAITPFVVEDDLDTIRDA
ncbi:MAG TPA: hypothetical protein PLN52_11340, partial [Opitutaceae bacterium]|nr:hypothetical protein [Opitutaceae bacterium]